MEVPSIYSIRSCSAWCCLAKEHFEATTGEGGSSALHTLGGGCLDAPDMLPGGSIKNHGRREPFVAPSLAQRDDEQGWTLKEQQRRLNLAERLIADLKG